MRYDFAVIGAGVSGLAASLLLAGCGYKVVLIEKGPRTAGMIRGFVRRGLRFDTGFHYAGGLADGDILDLFFRHLGLADRVCREPLDAAGFDIVRCLSTAFEFRFPYGPGQLRERLIAAFPPERAAIDTFLKELERAAAAFPYMNIDDEPAIPEGLQGPTLQEVLDRLSGNPLLKSVLSIHALLHGVSPAEVPFALHAVVAGPYYRSAHSLRGGGEALANAFDAELARRGVEVFCGEAAEAILIGEDGRPCGVRLAGGRTVPCGGCISTVHPRTLLDLVPPDVFRPVYRRRLAALAETPSACLLFGAVDELPAELRRSNLFLLAAPEAAGRLEEGAPDAGPLYVTAAAPARAENGGGYLAIAPVNVNVVDRWRGSVRGRRPADYLEWKDEMTRKMRARLECCFSGWSRRTTWSEGATPLTLGDYGHTPAGSLYGVKHGVGQMNPQAATRVPGLFLAGQATGGPGVLGAIISAYIACGAIAGHDRLRQEMRRCR